MSTTVNSENTTERMPLLIGVFDQIEAAAHAVKELGRAGFRADQISVLCSDDAKSKYFAEFEHEQPAGAQTDQALTLAGLGGLGLGGALLASSLLTSTGVGIVVAGGLACVALSGTFVALMVTRGSEKELADFYDQALIQGQILVGVETDDELLAERADAIFQQAGALPMRLPHEA